jgi:hypothetical protein
MEESVTIPALLQCNLASRIAIGATKEVAMKWKAALLSLGIALGALVTLAADEKDQNSRPWLTQENPSRLEWLALYKQATEGVTSYGTAGVTINFYVTPDSYKSGLIFLRSVF